MFADTIAITINAVAKTLVRINQDGYSSEYRLREATGEFSLKIRNTSYNDKTRSGLRVDRHNVELKETIYAVAPATINTVRKSYFTFEHDLSDTVVGPVKLSFGLANNFLTEANMTKMANGES